MYQFLFLSLEELFGRFSESNLFLKNKKMLQKISVCCSQKPIFHGLDMLVGQGACPGSGLGFIPSTLYSIPRQHVLINYNPTWELE